MQKLMTVSEVSEHFKIAAKTVWAMIKDGTLEAHKVRGRWRVTEASVEAVTQKKEAR